MKYGEVILWRANLPRIPPAGKVTFWIFMLLLSPKNPRKDALFWYCDTRDDFPVCDMSMYYYCVCFAHARRSPQMPVRLNRLTLLMFLCCILLSLVFGWFGLMFCGGENRRGRLSETITPHRMRERKEEWHSSGERIKTRIRAD